MSKHFDEGEDQETYEPENWGAIAYSFSVASPKTCGAICCGFLILLFFIIVMSVAPWHSSSSEAVLAPFETSLIKIDTRWKKI